MNPVEFASTMDIMEFASALQEAEKTKKRIKALWEEQCAASISLGALERTIEAYMRTDEGLGFVKKLADIAGLQLAVTSTCKIDASALEVKTPESMPPSTEAPATEDGPEVLTAGARKRDALAKIRAAVDNKVLDALWVEMKLSLKRASWGRAMLEDLEVVLQEMELQAQTYGDQACGPDLSEV